MEILTAYVREHAPWKPPPEDQQLEADEQRLATDIQAALTVIGRRKTDYDPLGIGLTCVIRTCAEPTSTRLTCRGRSS